MTDTNYIYAKLVGYTQPAGEFKESFDSEDVRDLIAFCARVSNPSNQYNTETSDRLLSYLIRYKHWSPFEMASATIEIQTTRDIARQLLRHRSFSFQEFSQRYADPTKDLGFVLREARLQDTKNRQNSIELQDNYLQTKWDIMQNKVIEATKEAYAWAIQNGLAKEQARSVLPEGLTLSKLYVQGTFRSYIHFLETRLDVSTQKEHRLLALEIAKAISQVFPFVKSE